MVFDLRGRLALLLPAPPLLQAASRGLLCKPPNPAGPALHSRGWEWVQRAHKARGARPLMSNRPSLEPRFHSAAAAPHPRPAGAPQIRLVFVPRTQCEKMSPRGRAPCPGPDNRPLNHQPSSSLFPSLAAGPRQRGCLGMGLGRPPSWSEPPPRSPSPWLSSLQGPQFRVHSLPSASLEALGD